MSFTYVIPDIHGRDDLLSRALLEIDAHASGKASVIVTIGDYVNKGPQSRQVIERLLPGIGGGWRFVALKGNHDAMMVDGLRDPAKQSFWLDLSVKLGSGPPCVQSSAESKLIRK